VQGDAAGQRVGRGAAADAELDLELRVAGRAIPADCTLRRTGLVATFAAGAGAGVAAGAAVVSGGPPDVTTSSPPTGVGFFFAAGCRATTALSGATGVDSDAGTDAPGRTTICVPVAWTAHVWRAAL
jgi:hypothetical protein